MTIQRREGSASRNLEALLPLSKEQDCMLVSDDRHPEDLMEGHMDATLRKAVELGADPVDAVRMATLVPARHYGLGSGVIREGLSADIVVMDDIERFQAREVFIDGVQAASDGVCLFGPKPLSTGSTFSLPEIGPESLEVRAAGQTATVRVIDAFGDQIFTREAFASLRAERGALQADPDQDVLHLAVVERYGHGNVGKGFVRGFGLKAGALASSVAHDSHNIITVGVDTVNMARAVNAVAEGGGIVAVDRDGMTRLPLPIAGLMSDEPADIVVGKLGRVHTHAKRLGCGFDSPFMTLSFLALLVIPELKLSDKGLFDSRSFGFVPVMKED
jgi:adenine deaminase